MPVHIKVAGAWKEVDDPHIRVAGGAWKSPDQVHVKVAGVWKEVLVAGGPLVIVAPTKTISNFRFLANCVANVRVHSDGDLYASTNTGGYGASYETWLDAGLNSEVWVQRTIISGTLTTDSGSSRLACTGIRTFGVTRTTAGVKTCVIDLKWYDAPSGGSLLDTQRVTLTATREDF